MKYSAVNNYESVPVWVHFRATSWLDFFNFVNDVKNHDSTPYWTFYVDNKITSLNDVEKQLQKCWDLFETKRNETKKPVRISQGATRLPNTFKTIWINK
jgi:hypothetical protein